MGEKRTMVTLHYNQEFDGNGIEMSLGFQSKRACSSWDGSPFDAFSTTCTVVFFSCHLWGPGVNVAQVMRGRWVINMCPPPPPRHIAGRAAGVISGWCLERSRHWLLCCNTITCLVFTLHSFCYPPCICFLPPGLGINPVTSLFLAAPLFPWCCPGTIYFLLLLMYSRNRAK